MSEPGARPANAHRFMGIKWPSQRADPWTIHVGIAAGAMAYRLRVHHDKTVEYGHGTVGPWWPIGGADDMDRRLIRVARWTPPLPEGVEL